MLNPNILTRPFYKDSNYTVYEDGRVFSHYTNQFLTPSIGKDKQVRYEGLGLAVILIWQSFYVELEPGSLIGFRDGDSTNISLSNLYIKGELESRQCIHSGDNDLHYADEDTRQFILSSFANKETISSIALNLGCGESFVYYILEDESMDCNQRGFDPVEYLEALRDVYAAHNLRRGCVPHRELIAYVEPVWKHKHGSRTRECIQSLFTLLKGELNKSFTIKDIKTHFNLDTYTAVQLFKLTQAN